VIAATAAKAERKEGKKEHEKKPQLQVHVSNSAGVEGSGQRKLDATTSLLFARGRKRKKEK